MKRVFILFFALAVLVIVPFLLWGRHFEESMTLAGTVAKMRDVGAWAWLIGLALLVLDLFLPILGTVVMSALGLVYGWVLGGIISSVGSIAAGLLAYGLCYRLGRRAARFLAGEEGLREGERLFHGELGGWLVALSRWMPVLPEVVASLAGISQMPLRRFFPALCAGSVPMGFVFARIGEAGEDRPGLALLLSAVLPPLLWALFRIFYRWREKTGDPERK